MDILVPIPMKSAAKCDTQCELQNSANHQILERNWRWEDTLPACLFQCLKTSQHNLMCLMSSSLTTICDILHERCMRGSLGSIELVTDYSVISYGLYKPLIYIKRIEVLTTSSSASEIRQEHPLNLSILLSGGKEINEDCLSSGERSGKSSIRIGYLRWLNCNLKVRAKGKIEA